MISADTESKFLLKLYGPDTIDEARAWTGDMRMVTTFAVAEAS